MSRAPPQKASEQVLAGVLRDAQVPRARTLCRGLPRQRAQALRRVPSRTTVLGADRACHGAQDDKNALIATLSEDLRISMLVLADEIEHGISRDREFAAAQMEAAASHPPAPAPAVRTEHPPCVPRCRPRRTGPRLTALSAPARRRRSGSRARRCSRASRSYRPISRHGRRPFPPLPAVPSRPSAPCLATAGRAPR